MILAIWKNAIYILSSKIRYMKNGYGNAYDVKNIFEIEKKNVSFFKFRYFYLNSVWTEIRALL